MADVKIFLSCVSDEFGAYREALRHALTHRWVEVKIQEDFSATGGDTLAMLEDYIESCNAVVHFIGEMTGSAPVATSVNDLLKRRPELAARLAKKGMTREVLGTLSYTQWEAWLAVGSNKDGAKRNLVVVVPGEGALRRPRFEPTEASRESQAEHLQRLVAIDVHPGPPFTNADNLALQVLKSAVVEPALSSAWLMVKATPSGVKLQTMPPFVFRASLLAAIAGVWIFVVGPLIESERKLRNEFDKAQAGGTIGNLIQDEDWFWRKGDLGPRLTELERCCKPDSRKLQQCVEVDPCKKLLEFIDDSVKGNDNQLERISKITDFYINIARMAADNIVPLSEACEYFADEINRWQSSYYLVLKRLEAENGRPFHGPLVDFANNKCQTNPSWVKSLLDWLRLHLAQLL